MKKKCYHCKQTLPLTDFHIKRASPDGHRSYCKACAIEITKRKYHSDSSYRQSLLDREHEIWINHPEKKRESHNKAIRKYRKTHKKKINEVQKVNRLLKKTGLSEQVCIRAKGKCENCGKPIIKIKGCTTYAIHHLNGNRLDNRLENLLLVCPYCHLHVFHNNIPRTIP